MSPAVNGAHVYFAYGSNLCAEQMADRCPGAVDPRPAVLHDHDWLINQRGVATVERFPGGEVHGVLWHITDADLEFLDRAEGVPTRYRRDRLTVQTTTGPTDAWVYIDHRNEPGRPREGYLERIIDGAEHHGLPRGWIDYLSRWDPSGWHLRRPAKNEGPQSLSELLSDPAVEERSTLRSRFGFLAIHGGGLEQMTDVIAERAALQAGASVYAVVHPPDYPHHLSSTRYLAQESARLAEFLAHVDVAVSVHGYGRIGRSRHLLAGGGHRELARHLAHHLDVPGFEVVTDMDAIPRELRGLHPDNPVNRTGGGGVQLELSARVRGISLRSGPPAEDGLHHPTSALITGLATAARQWTEPHIT